MLRMMESPKNSSEHETKRKTFKRKPKITMKTTSLERHHAEEKNMKENSGGGTLERQKLAERCVCWMIHIKWECQRKKMKYE
jgi:hypothetical protein